MDLMDLMAVYWYPRSWLVRVLIRFPRFIRFYDFSMDFTDLWTFPWNLPISHGFTVLYFLGLNTLRFNRTDHFRPIKSVKVHKLPVKPRRRVGFLIILTKTVCTVFSTLLKTGPPYKDTRHPGNVNTKHIFISPIQNRTGQSLISSNRLGYTKGFIKYPVLPPIWPVSPRSEGEEMYRFYCFYRSYSFGKTASKRRFTVLGVVLAPFSWIYRHLLVKPSLDWPKDGQNPGKNL